MAEGFLNQYIKGEYAVFSAGIETHGLNQMAVKAMKEVEIDISHHRSNHVDEFAHVVFDYVITVCDHARENCPYFLAKKSNLHHNFPDPALAKGTHGERMNAFRSCRNEIDAYCKNFSEEINKN